MIRILVIPLLALSLAACETTGTGSIAGGECRVFEAPEYAVRGATPYDQNWVDGNVEAGVAGCKWSRPKARPAALDAPRAKAPTKAPVKKPSLYSRIKAKLPLPKPRPKAEYVQPPPIPYLETTIPAPPPPRDPVDELLRP